MITEISDNFNAVKYAESFSRKQERNDELHRNHGRFRISKKSGR